MAVATSTLTVPQAAEQLGMTPAGVYKLIQRGKLKAIRLSARKTQVAQEALDDYTAAHQAAVSRLRARSQHKPADLRAWFITKTGHTPEHWLAAWKKDAISDTAENAKLLVEAVALREVPADSSSGDTSERVATTPPRRRRSRRPAEV